MADKPTTCPKCGASLLTAKWSVLYGLTGPAPFTQCPSCQSVITPPAEGK